MDVLKIIGGKKIGGEVEVSGAKNVAMKVIIAATLTNENLKFTNIPHISSVIGTLQIVGSLGVKAHFLQKNCLLINASGLKKYKVPFEMGGRYRSVTMLIGPLLAKFGKVLVPNPGGCRIGKRPIDQHIRGLEALGAKVYYKDGYFYVICKKLRGCRFHFEKNTHTGTESLILAAVCAKGRTILTNVAEEPEIDDLITLLNKMGAQIGREKNRTIVINGVSKLHGVNYKIMPDRNEMVTFIIAALYTGGKIIIKNAEQNLLSTFLKTIEKTGAHWRQIEQGIYFWKDKDLKATQVTTRPHPGFMTDWQAPWALLMTQANGQSDIHETIFEDRFGYVNELLKMGARISFYSPRVKNPKKFYNFHWHDRGFNKHYAIKIFGPTKLHNAVLEISDLRAGATLVIAALGSTGVSYIYGVEHIDRGYENFDGRLNKLGAKIQRLKYE